MAKIFFSWRYNQVQMPSNAQISNLNPPKSYLLGLITGRGHFF